MIGLVRESWNAKTGTKKMTKTASGMPDTGSGGSYGNISPPSFSDGTYARYNKSEDDYVQEFYRLLRKWRYETLTSSSGTEMISRQEFTRIVALGKKAVPLIIDEIRTNPDYVMAALPLITNEDPVPDNVRGNMTEMANAWIAWYEREKR